MTRKAGFENPQETRIFLTLITNGILTICFCLTLTALTARAATLGGDGE